MNIGYLILSSSSYCAIMILVYVVCYGLSSHLFRKIKIYYEIGLGFVFGLISIFALIAATSIVKTQVEKNFMAYWQILLVFICGVFISPYTLIPVAGISIVMIFVVPTYVPDLFFQSMAISDYETMGIVLSAATLIMTIIYFIKIKWPKSLTFLMLTVSSVLVFLIVLLAHISDSGITKLFGFLVWFVSGYSLYVAAYFTDRIHNHAIRLRQLIEEEDEFYISSDGVREKLKMLIAREHVSQGFLFSYFITQYDLLDKSVSPVVRDFIWQNITRQIKEKISAINPSAFFFHENYKVNGFFVPIDSLEPKQLTDAYVGNNKKIRLNDDVLKQFADIFANITQNYNVENYRISIKLRAICSTYGVHSANFNTLIENNSLVIQNKDRLVDKNQIYLVNPKELSEIEYESRKLKTLNSISSVTSSSVLFEPMYNVETNTIDSTFLNYIVDGNVVFPFKENQEQLDQIKDYGLYSMFFRFLAFKGLKDVAQFNTKTDLFMFYDSKFVSSERFSATEFITRLKKTSVKKENLVLVFDVNGEIENVQVLAKNVVKLKGYGIRVALLNFAASKYEFAIIPHYQPDYIIIDGSLAEGLTISRENRKIIEGILNIANKIEAKVIAPKIKSFIIYKSLKNLGIDKIYGDIIGSSTQFKNSLTDEQVVLLRK